ncbi:hypothetical protein BDP27DRAFT_1455479 [Rhodocollybia butyracea]|uniref:Uncharacterized protein n=1 Tax=Rhodocollybia butyracea TaxID=206335 RepID=A0A9P5P7N3_9AGAR|nr:hypothetical protein BDP27DRAFT_1455479 [Rhodocollybia butyracea]
MIEPGSPTLSTSSSGSDVEELSISGPGSSTLASSIPISSSSSKRRLNPGVASNRDPKSRRLKVHGAADERRDREHGVRGGNWEMGKDKKEKDELLDMFVVEYLRKEIGDPFLEISLD